MDTGNWNLLLDKIVRFLCVLAIILISGFVIFILGGSRARADTPATYFVKDFGAASSSTVPGGLTRDSAGNFYILGSFSGTTLTIGTATLTKIGSGDGFVAKFAADGTFIWAQNFGGTGNVTVVANAITVDAQSTPNIYVTGYFYDGNLTAPAITQIGTGTIENGYVLKMSSAGGGIIWAQGYGGASANLSLTGIAVDTAATPNVYVSGVFTDSDLTTPSLTRHSSNANVSGLYDGLVLKLEGAAGSTIWARNFGDTNTSTIFNGIAVDGNATPNVYVAGNFSNGDIPGLGLTRIGSGDALVLKLPGANGTPYTWAKNYGGAGASASFQTLALDSAATPNIFAAGYFSSANLTNPAVTKIGTQDGLVMKIPSDTGTPAWAQNFGGAGATTRLNNIAIDQASTPGLYLSGYFRSANLSSPALTRLGSGSAFDALIFKIPSTGGSTINWAQNFGGSSASTYFYGGIAVDTAANPNAYALGYLLSGNPTRPSITKIGNKDAWFAKIGPTVPDAPTSVSASVGDGQAVVSFTAPANAGGSPVTSYTVSSNPGGGSASGSSSPITIAGLTNGTAYTFSVAAVNALGTGASASTGQAATPIAATPPVTVTVPVVLTTTPATTTGTGSSTGASGLGTASAMILPSTIASAGNLNTSGPITYTLSSPSATSGSVVPVGSTTGTTTTSNSVSATTGTLTLNVTPSNPTAATGTSVAVSFNTSTGQFTLVSPVITRPGARVNQTKKSSDAVIRAPSAAPAAPVYQVTAPKVLALNSFATLTATDASGSAVNVNIPITLYAPGEVSDLVAISLDQYGNMGASASTAPALSRDGQVTSFVSNANNIGAFGNVSAPQIFRYATALATVDLISQSASISGTLSGVAAQSASLNPALSADGSILAFASDAANIYPYSIFTRPATRQLYTIAGNAAVSGTTTSPNPAVLINNAPSAYAFDRPALSSDGTRLAFDTTAPLAGTSGGVSQVYVKNLTTGVVTLASSTSAGVAGNAASLNASLSDDGRYVLFDSDATNLAPGSSARQVYLKDLTTGTLTLISAASGKPGNAQSLNGKLSGQVTYAGQPGYVVFESDASNLVSASNNGQRQVYRVNLATGAISLVSANGAGIAVGGSNAAISGDGRFVVFKSAGAVTGTTAPTSAQIYVADTYAGTTALVSADVNGLPGNAAADSPTISADGRTIGFVSLATNLDGTATNGVNQAYIAANKLVPPLVTGFWVNPNVPGQNWGIEQSGNKLWIGGFGYYNDNTPGWVFATESGLTSNAFQGSLLSTANGPSLAGIGGPAVIASNLGVTGLTVSGQTSGTLSWLSSTGAIQRNDLITGGSSAGPVAGYPETGWWYAPSTNQSFFLEVQGTTLQANIASYSASGKATWYQTTGAMTSAQAYTGTLNACTGGVAPNCTTSAGPVSLTFSSTLAGTITLPGGKALAIQRFRF